MTPVSIDPNATLSHAEAVLELVQACRASPSWQDAVWDQGRSGLDALVCAVAQVLLEAGQPASVVEVELCTQPMLEGSSAYDQPLDARYASFLLLAVGASRFSFDPLTMGPPRVAVAESDEGAVALALEQWGMGASVDHYHRVTSKKPGAAPSALLAETRSLGAPVLARLAQDLLGQTTPSSRPPRSLVRL